MPKLGKKKTDEAPAQAPVQTGAPAGDQPPAPVLPTEPVPPKEPVPPNQRELPKESHVVLTLLTILLVLLGLAELLLLGYIGYQTFRSSQARKAYEAQQTTVDDEGNVTAQGAFYIGPLIHIEDGEVVWRRPDSLYATGAGAGTDVSGEGDGEPRLADMSVVRRSYSLAQDNGTQQQ